MLLFVQVNVIGVVAAVSDSPTPVPSSKAPYSCYFELVDESETTVMCTMLETNRDHLPKSLCCGDVVCLRKVAMEQGGEKLVAVTSNNTTWLLFRKQEDFKPSSNFTNLSLSPSERNRLADLKEWVAGAGEREKVCTTKMNYVPDNWCLNYSGIMVLAIALHFEQHVSVVLLASIVCTQCTNAPMHFQSQVQSEVK